MKANPKGASAPKFRLITNSQHTPDQQAVLEKFEISYRADLEHKYIWSLKQFHWSPLDEQAREELEDAYWDIREIVENAQTRARKNRLTLVRPSYAARPVSAEVQHG